MEPEPISSDKEGFLVRFFGDRVDWATFCSSLNAIAYCNRQPRMDTTPFRGGILRLAPTESALESTGIVWKLGNKRIPRKSDIKVVTLDRVSVDEKK